MKNMVFVISTFFFLTSLGHAQTRGSPPTITFSYAQEKIRSGDIWRIYLSADDPDGDMTRIVSAIEQTGRGRYPADIIRLKKGMEGRFSGYIYLLTTSFRDFWGVTLTLTLTIEDRVGNSSGPIVFPLEFNSEPIKPLPPDTEKDLNRPIGAIGIELTRPPYGL